MDELQLHVANLSSSLLTCAKEHGNILPESLVAPVFQSYMPACPAAQSLTYNYETTGKVFTISCAGKHHLLFAVDAPQHCEESLLLDSP